MKSIVFFADATVLPGLHVTLLSLLDSLAADADARIIVFTDGVSHREKEMLRQTHAVHPHRTTLTFIDFAPKSPEGANSLNGNCVVYGRIYLADLLPDIDVCVYLDCDLVVCKPVDELFTLIDGQHTIYVDGTGKRCHSLDQELFRQAGLDMNGPYFNSGIMGLDLRLWRSRDRNAACQSTARKYPGLFRSADQALLNLVFHDDFLAVGDKFNTPLYPSSATLDGPADRIYHFVGSPKPWDVMGSYLHSNYALWKQVYDRTAIRGRSPWRYTSLKRTLRISRSMLKAWIAQREASTSVQVGHA